MEKKNERLKVKNDASTYLVGGGEKKKEKLLTVENKHTHSGELPEESS